MEQAEVIEIFNEQAKSYDTQWNRLSAINGALHLLADAVLSELPSTANLLCVGAGTGNEVIHFADKFPGWRFTVVEPSNPMLSVFRSKAEAKGILSRCELHAGFLETLPCGEAFDAATAFLVSQFILNREERIAFFQNIAKRLRPDGLLVSSDLAGDLESGDCQNLLKVWFNLMSNGGIAEEGIQKMRKAYASDVAVLPSGDVANILKRGGFGNPVQFLQAGMIHAWFARRRCTGSEVD